MPKLKMFIVLLVVLSGSSVFAGSSTKSMCKVPEGWYVVTGFFGEKSGYDAGFDAYNVDQALSRIGLKSEKCKGSLERVLSVRKSRSAALNDFRKISDLKSEKGWLHFYLTGYRVLKNKLIDQNFE